MRASPKVVVVTVNWNGRKWLADFLTSALALRYPSFEIVLVDNASADGSAEYVRGHFPAVHVVETGGNLGYGGGISAGLAYGASRGADYFLIVNNDTVLDPDALTALLETAQSSERAGFVTGKIYLYDQPDTLHTVGKRADSVRLNGTHIGWLEKDTGQYDAVAERAFADDVMLLVDRRIFDELGGYDPVFFLHSAEFDYQMRAKLKGWRIYYTPKAKLWHRVSMSLGGFGSPVARFFYVYSNMIVVSRYSSKLRFAAYYLRTLARLSYAYLRGVVSLNLSQVRLRSGSVLGFAAGTLWLVNRRPMTQVPRIVQWLNR